MAHLVVFCGLPGSGKTTFYNTFKSVLSTAVYHISPDVIRTKKFPGPYNPKNNKQVWAIAHEQLAQLANKTGVVVLDATMLTIWERLDTFRHSWNVGYTSTGVICFDVPVQECIRRQENPDRDKKLNEQTVLKMAQRFVLPTFREDVVSYILKTSNGTGFQCLGESKKHIPDDIFKALSLL